MPHAFRNRLLLTAALLIAGHSLAADGNSTKTMDLRFLSWDGQGSRPLYIQTEDGVFERLELRSNRRSPRINVPRAPRLHLFADGRDEEGNPIKEAVTEVTINGRIDEPLLLLFDRGDQNRPPVALVLEDTVEAFPFGSYRVVNFTEFPVVFELDGEPHTLAPRTSALVQPDLSRRENLTMRLMASIDGEARLIRQTYWRHQPGQRMLVFVVNARDPGRKELVLHTVVERKSAERSDAVDSSAP